MKEKIFVFNDESIENSYGFSVKTSGISLSRFEKNPIMLDSHKNDTQNVLGSWKQLKKENGLLTGVPVFDTEKGTVKELSGQVERGFIKSCSMGISFSKKDMKLENGKLILDKCELTEVSIVAIPSNSNALTLYVKTDTGEELLSSKEAKELCLSFSNAEPKNMTHSKKNNTTDMKVKLNTEALSVLNLREEEHTGAELSALIVTLAKENEQNKKALEALKEANEKQELRKITDKVKLAISLGKIPANKEEDFIKLGVSNPELLETTLSAIPEKQKLGSKIQNNSGSAMTKEAFLKLDDAEKLSFKENNSEEYLQLFTTKN